MIRILLFLALCSQVIAEDHIVIQAKIFEREAATKKESVLSAPKLLCLDGQAAGLAVGESITTTGQEIMTGITLELTPKRIGERVHLDGFLRLREKAGGKQPDGVLLFETDELFFDLKPKLGETLTLQKRRANGNTLRVELTASIRADKPTTERPKP